MKRLIKTAILALSIVLTPATVAAADFVDTGTPDENVGIGLRFGLTSSNLHGNLDDYSNKANYNWRTGFTFGAVVDLNVRNFFTVQPGLFFENRSYDYTVIRHDKDLQALYNDLGHTRSYSFTIPILASFRFNLSESLQWTLDVGPYFAFGLGGKDNMEQIHAQVSPVSGNGDRYMDVTVKRDYYGDGMWQHKSFDWGAKLGTSLRLNRQLVFAIYYMKGFKDISAYEPWTMRTKSWSFSVGYDF